MLVAVIAVVVAAVVYTFLTLERYGICASFPSASIAPQNLNLVPCFLVSFKPVFFDACFSLPLLLAPCGFQSSTYFPTESSSFNGVRHIHRHFLSLICNIIGFYPVVSQQFGITYCPWPSYTHYSSQKSIDKWL